MTDPEPRTAEQRKQDTLAMLTTPEIDVWVATASTSEAGEPSAHLVPLSLAWLDDRVVLALASSSVTARSLAATGRTRLGLGPTRDVTMIDAVVESHGQRRGCAAADRRRVCRASRLGSARRPRGLRLRGAASHQDPVMARGQ